MSMYDKNHYNIVISLQLIKINGKKIKMVIGVGKFCTFIFIPGKNYCKYRCTKFANQKA